MIDSQGLSVLDEIDKLSEKIDQAIEISKGDKGDTPTEEEIIALIKPLIPKPIKGDKGETTIVEKVIEKTETIIKEQPIVTEVTNEIVKEVALTDTGEQIVKKINDLPIEEEYQIGIEHIKGLPKKLEELDKKASRLVGSVGGSSGKGMVKFYDLSTQTDGIKTVFTVPKSLSAIIIGSDFPTILMENNGFTLNASRTQVTLTTINPPSAGSQFLYQYTSVFNT